MAADTIFALSSGAPPAAIALIRISGPAAQATAQKLAGHVPTPRRASLAVLRDPMDDSLLDQALMLFFPGPNSATGEDLLELHLHGGRAVVRAVEAVLSTLPDLRPAEAGEFTRRAFSNGRMDLNEAEALSDLLSAETEWQRRSAAHMLGGGFSSAIEDWRNGLLRISALVEAELDFSDEDDVDDQNKQKITISCNDLHDVMARLLSAPRAEKLRDGLRIVLGGPPNSGKSTLLNALVERDAAIVSDIAGTTRDVIEIPLSLDGIPLLLIDTAGVRDDSKDAIEKIGIDRAQNAFATADMILWLGAEHAGPQHENLIEVDAKIDAPNPIRKSSAAIAVSAQTGEGMPYLVAHIIENAKNLLPPQNSFAINARQHRLLGDAADALAAAGNADDWLIVAEHLRQARLALDALTGRTHTEDVLDTLFSRFCVGK